MELQTMKRIAKEVVIFIVWGITAPIIALILVKYGAENALNISYIVNLILTILIFVVVLSYPVRLLVLFVNWSIKSFRKKQ